MQQADKFQILSLSGGGYLGLYQITILCELEQKAGKPIAQCFDLIAGTSIGGIVALSLALEVPAIKIMYAFEKHGQSIFSCRGVPKSPLGKFQDLLRSFLSPKYKDNGLSRALEEFIPPLTLIGDLKHPVVVPAINLTKGEPQIFKTPHHKTFEKDYLETVHNVALATSAAPTFFPLAQVQNQLFTDGGLYANMPDLIALHEAEHFFQIPTKNISILSIGTTTAKFSFSHSIGRNLGSLRWLYENRLFSVILSSQQKMTEYMLQHKLGERYVRIDSTQSKDQERDLGLDVATVDAQSTIKGLAEASFRENIVNNKLQKMLEYTAREPNFYYGSFKNQNIEL